MYVNLERRDRLAVAGGIDGLRSYEAAMNDLGSADEQKVGRWASNRSENPHLPFGRRERAMLWVRRMKTLQKFASVHANVHNHFNLERHLVDHQIYREHRAAALAEWQVLVSQAATLKDRHPLCGKRFASDRQHPR
jgi:putative transposase